jgi:hypothetical protein
MGSWCAFLAVLATFAVWRNRAREAVVPLVALVLWPLAAVAGAIRSFDGLQPSSRRSIYLFVLVGMATLGGVGLRADRRAAGGNHLRSGG